MSRLVVSLVLAFSAKRGLCDPECWDACPGSVYTGTLSVTINGKTCQAWSKYFPGEDSASNYCRDPQGIGQPGCYITDSGVPYEFCDVPICDYECCYDEQNLTQFVGKTSVTYTGKSCLAWTDQTFPYNFNNDSLFPADTSVALSRNYCRDPDNSGVVWCYVEDDDNKYGRTRQQCAIPKCHPYSIYCGGILRVGQGWIRPKFLDSGQWVVCEWSLVADEGNSITVQITELNLRPNVRGECSLDRISVFDGVEESKESIFSMCGNTAPEFNITSSSNKMTIQFEGMDRWSSATDGIISFNISYSEVEGTAYCDEWHTMTAGFLVSPDSNSDGVYESNLDCWYTIVAAKGLVVQLAVLDIDMFGRKLNGETFDQTWEYCRIGHTLKKLRMCHHFPARNMQKHLFSRVRVEVSNRVLDPEQTVQCCSNFIKIHAGDEDGDFTSYIGQFCALPPPPLITTRNNKLLVIFNTGRYLQSDGFFAMYSATVNRTEYFAGILNDMNGLVAVASRYQMHGEWTITATDDLMLHLCMITMEFVVTKTQDCEMSAALQIFDGASNRSSLIETICGFIPPSTIESTSGALTLVYFSYYVLDEVWPTFVAWYRTFPRTNATLRHDWPSGIYSLPMTTYGCNDPEGNQWSSAYINITFKHNVHVSNQDTGKVGMKSPSLLAGPYGDRSYQMNFCVRKSESTMHNNEKDERWPPGNYMIYGTKNGCPSGLIPVNVSKIMPEILHVNTDGHAPQIVFHSLGTRSWAEILVCYKSSDMDGVDMNFNSIFPFAVLSANEHAEKQKSPEFVTEDISFITNDDQDRETEYQWFMFDIYLPERLNEQYRVKKGVSKQYKPWELGRADEQYLHDEFSAADYPPYGPGWSENGGNRRSEWLLYDLGQSMSINALRFVKMAEGSYINGFYTAVPEIMISESKWSFLYNGASLCLRSIYRLKHVIEVTCLNGQPASAGRYITFLLRRPILVNILQRIQKRFWKIQINRAEKSDRCNQFLGMTDNSIGDFQISSSSSRINFPPRNSRPYSTGWCANENDDKPYVQVDLDYPTQIEGVRIFNWWSAGGSENGSTFGVNQFSLDIGVDINFTISSSKTKVFKVDQSLPVENAHTFIFVAPIIGQYVRIAPLTGAAGSDYMCLKFELIGCLYTGNNGTHKSFDEFEFKPDSNTDCGVSYP